MDKEQEPTTDDYRDARGPEWRAIFDTLRDYRLSNMTYEGTSDEFYPLVDLMSNDGQGIDTGERQMIELADEISLALATRRSSDEQAEVVGSALTASIFPGGTDVLFFASYCGEDNPACTPARPCADCIAMSNVHRIPSETKVLFQREFGASPPAVAAGGVTEEMARAALALLAAEDARQDKLHDLLETIREQIRLEVAPEQRPDGLMVNIQNAVYAMRGRTRLMNDAALTAALAVREGEK